VASLLAALLKQTAAGVEQIQAEIKVAFDRAKRKVDDRILRPPKIHGMLTKSAPALRQGFICVDALDKFLQNIDLNFWSLLYIVPEYPSPRLFATGRPLIRQEVKNNFPEYPDLSSVKPTKRGIPAYVSMHLKE